MNLAEFPKEPVHLLGAKPDHSAETGQHGTPARGSRPVERLYLLGDGVEEIFHDVVDRVVGWRIGGRSRRASWNFLWLGRRGSS